MDLASYALSADPQQRQAMLAEILRQRAAADHQEQLAGAFKKSRSMDNAAVVAAMSMNPELAAAAKLAQANANAGAPKQLGAQGFMLPETGQFVDSPIFTEEKRAARETQRDIARDRITAQADAGAANRSLREALAAQAEEGRNSRAADALSLRQALAAARLTAASNKPEKVKAVPANEVRKLTDRQATAAGFLDLHDSFKDEFGGSGSDIIDSLKNEVGKKQPLGLGKDWADKSNWWQNYNTYKNEVRHGQFGSALTAAEQKAFDAANITEGMEAGEVRRKLAQQAAIAAKAYNRLKSNFGAAGYDTEGFEDLREPAAVKPGVPAVPKPAAPKPAAPKRIRFDANGNEIP